MFELKNFHFRLLLFFRFSGKFELVERILFDKSTTMIGPLSVRMGRDCFKIPDNLWQLNFQHFQIDLTDCVKLDARYDNQSIDSAHVS